MKETPCDFSCRCIVSSELTRHAHFRRFHPARRFRHDCEQNRDGGLFIQHHGLTLTATFEQRTKERRRIKKKRKIAHRVILTKRPVSLRLRRLAYTPLMRSPCCTATFSKYLHNSSRYKHTMICFFVLVFVRACARNQGAFRSNASTESTVCMLLQLNEHKSTRPLGTDPDRVMTWGQNITVSTVLWSQLLNAL